MATLRLNSKITLDKSQPLFLGIDVHKKTLSISVIHQESLIQRLTIPQDENAIVGFISKYTDYTIFSVYEAGYSGFHLHYFLESLRVKNIITPPNKIPTVVGDRVKTDKNDSLKLAWLLSKSMLKAIYIPSSDQLATRQFLRTRQQMVKKKVSVSNQIKLLLLQQGIQMHKTGITEKEIQRVFSFPLREELKLNLSVQVDTFRFLENQIEKLENTAIDSLKEDEQIKIQTLRSIPGVGKITALTLLREIGDWTRFSNKKKLAAYVGLTPCEYSSGEHIKKSRITGQGNPTLRSLLIEASWVLVRKDPAMELVFNRLVSQTSSKKKAIVGIARRLIIRIHALMQRGEQYQIGLVC